MSHPLPPTSESPSLPSLSLHLPAACCLCSPSSRICLYLHRSLPLVPPLPQPDDVIGVSVVSDQRPPEWAVIGVSMSEVLPFSEAEQRGHYADGGDGQIPLTCRLQDTGNFYGSSGQGGGKRPPKLGQIGRSKRVVIEEDERIEAVLMSEKAPPAV